MSTPKLHLFYTIVVRMIRHVINWKNNSGQVVAGWFLGEELQILGSDIYAVG